MTDYIDDDRDVITAPGPRIDFEKAAIEKGVEIAAAGDREKVVGTVSIGTEHVQAQGWWQRTRDGVQSFGARVRAVWGRK
jgi:hypothetical protein